MYFLDGRSRRYVGYMERENERKSEERKRNEETTGNTREEKGRNKRKDSDLEDGIAS